MFARRHRGAALVAALAVAVYLNALPNGFVYDDHALIRFNRAMHDSARLASFFTGDLWSRLGSESTNYYRPLPPLLLAAVHAASGPAPWAYRLVNLLLHALASVLVLRLLVDLGRGRPPDEHRESERAALATAALFAVHPVHVEAVAWVSGVMDVACAAFVLLAFDLYRRAGGAARGRRLTAFGLLAFVLALLSKEPAAVLPLLLVGYELLAPRSAPVSPRAIARRTAPWFAVLALYLALRAVALGGLAPLSRLALPAAGDVILLLADVFARYARALFVPLDLSIGHAAAAPESWMSPRGVVALAVLAATAALAWAAWRRERTALFGLAFYLVALAPALYLPGLVMPLSKLFAERFLYLPSVGWAIVIAVALQLAARRSRRGKRFVALVATALVLVFGALTVAQNRVWQNEVSVWRDAVAKYPEHGMNHLDYGNALVAAGDAEAGRLAFARAAALDPGVVDFLVHQGRRRLESGHFNDAYIRFEQALAVAPGSFEALLGAADAANGAGWSEMATHRYRAALALRPDAAAARNGYGYLLARQGRLDAAIEQFEAAVRAAPEDPTPLRNLATALERRGEAARAAEMRRRAEALGGRRPE